MSNEQTKQTKQTWDPETVFEDAGAGKPFQEKLDPGIMFSSPKTSEGGGGARDRIEDEIDAAFHEDSAKPTEADRVWIRNLQKLDHGIEVLKQELQEISKTIDPLLVPDKDTGPGGTSCSVPGGSEPNSENGPESKLFKFIDQALYDRVCQITALNYMIRSLRRRIEL